MGLGRCSGIQFLKHAGKVLEYHWLNVTQCDISNHLVAIIILYLGWQPCLDLLQSPHHDSIFKRGRKGVITDQNFSMFVIDNITSFPKIGNYRTAILLIEGLMRGAHLVSMLGNVEKISSFRFKTIMLLEILEYPFKAR